LSVSVSRYMPAIVIAAIAGSAGCGSSTEPVLIPIPDETEEATLADVSGSTLTDPSAFDVITGQAVRTDQFSGWDFLFEIQDDGSAVLWPREAVTEEDPDAGLQLSSRTFEDLVEAPEEGYSTSESVSVAVGDVFAVRSRRDPAYGSIRCRRYAKLEILDLDAAGGTVTFRHLVNPNCEKRKLVPGAES